MLAVIFVCLVSLVCSANAGAAMTWLGGSNVINQPTSPSWPGGRAGCATWRRPGGGGVILFGGNTSTQLLSDLWQMAESFSGVNWTRISDTAPFAVYGTVNVPSPTNRPGPRQGASTWLNAAGTGGFLFGGLGNTQTATIGYLNDLWFLDFNTFVWTWISGSSSTGSLGTYPAIGSNQLAIPRSRYYAIVAQSSSSVYLFGGAFASTATSVAWTYLQDFFVFDLSTQEFQYLGGSTTAAAGVYSGSTPFPGGRESAFVWWRGSTFFMALGFGYTKSTSASGYLQEIWAFDTSKQQWSLRYGTQDLNVVASFTSQPLQQSFSALPGSREDAIGFVLPDGVLMFGGTGFSSSALVSGWLADAWLFDEVNNLWIWYGGPQSVNPIGSYAIVGQTGWPGGCAELSTYMSDIYGAMIIFGRGYGSAGGNGYLNAIWNMTLPASVRAAVNFAAVPSQGLSGGAIAGIVVGSIVGAALIVVMIVLIATSCGKRSGQSRRANQVEMSSQYNQNAAEMVPPVVPAVAIPNSQQVNAEPSAPAMPEGQYMVAEYGN